MSYRNTDYTHPLLQHLSPLLATQARRRMMVMAGTALFFSLFSAGVETILPLWVTKDLGFTADQWAQLRSLRFFGVFIGVILLGALSDRFGQRLLSVISMLGAAASLIGFWCWGKQVIWIVMPIYGTLVSTAFVNLNTLIQQVSARRQGVANSIYRAIGAGAGIMVPATVTWLGAQWGGYPRVFGLCAALLVASAIILWQYPGEETPPALGKLRDELRQLGGIYLTAVKQRQMMIFIVLSMVWGNVLAGVGAFFAVYYTLPEYLHQSDASFGKVMSIAGGACLLATLLTGLFLDRISLKKLHGVAGVLTGVCSLAMGLTESPVFIALGFIIFSLVASTLVGPSSMWVSRVAGDGTQTAAFTVHKVFAALFLATAMWVMSLLEKTIGIRLIFLYGGILGIVTALGFFFLPEPPLPGKRMRTHETVEEEKQETKSETLPGIA